VTVVVLGQVCALGGSIIQMIFCTDVTASAANFNSQPGKTSSAACAFYWCQYRLNWISMKEAPTSWWSPPKSDN
jgi:hypothetical protein